jgi:hypothetical protein
MSTKQETILQQNIVKAIKRKWGAGAWVMKIHGGPYQKAGVPDLLVIIAGRAYWIEVKRPGEVPTAIQKNVMQELMAAGCDVVVTTCAPEAASWLEEVTDKLKSRGV